MSAVTLGIVSHEVGLDQEALSRSDVAGMVSMSLGDVAGSGALSRSDVAEARADRLR